LSIPTLIVWGAHDPFIPSRFGDAYGVALGAEEVVQVADAGHWPWLDRPDVIERIASFLDS
jgi:pimeloyl-ACP methyl ester carboxylesterase